MLDYISLETALQLMLSRVSPARETEDVPLLQSLGMICAEDVFSAIDVPSFDRSPLDGFAFNSADTAGASRDNPARLRVVETVHAGCVPKRSVLRGEAVKIMTGAMIPCGCDCVAPKEHTEEKAGEARIFQSYSRFQNYSFKAGDFPKGERLVSAGEKIDSARMGILAGAGTGSLRVFRKPRVGLLCSGDELLKPGNPPEPGKIYNGNYPLFAGRLAELGFEIARNPDEDGEDGWFIPDDPEEAAGRIETLAGSAGAVITTGGVSVGDKDIFHDVFTILNVQKLFWRMNFKPGMSVLCGIYQEKPLMCLSGNPFAALAVFELLARPVLEHISAHTAWKRARKRSVMKAPFPKASGTRRFVRAFYDETGVALPFSAPAPGNPAAAHSNAALFSLIGCNCLVDIPAGSPPLKTGDEVEVVLI